MAVYQGTPVAGVRLRAPAPAPQVSDTLPGRAAARRVTRDQRSLRLVGAALGIILVLTLVGIVYLSQALRIASDKVLIDHLAAEQRDLTRELASQQGTILRAGSEQLTVYWAQGHGLQRLGKAARFKAR